MILAHVWWLGGSACAGKSSIARRLAVQHELTHYSCDDRFEEHRKRADPVRHRRFRRVAGLAVEELWSRPAEVQAEELLGFYEDEMEMVLEDLAAMSGPVLAEGVGLLPARVADVLAAPWRAVWLLATPELRQRLYPRRGSWVHEMLARTPDPEHTFAGWMERDSLVAAAIAKAARSSGLTVLTVDGRRGVEEIAGDVARRFRLTEA